MGLNLIKCVCVLINQRVMSRMGLCPWMGLSTVQLLFECGTYSRMCGTLCIYIIIIIMYI